MLTKVTKLKNSEAELEVELEKNELQNYLKKTGEQISKVVKIDGFRASKIPFDVLRKNIGDKKILEEALEFAITDSLAKALVKEKMEVISSYDLKIMENTIDALKFSIKLLTFPEVKLGDYKNLGASRKEVIVEEKEVDNMLEYILKSHSTYKDADEPAQKGHHLEVDFEVAENGRLIDGGKSENHPLILGKGSFIPGFEDELEGLKKGETKTFSLTAPNDYYQKGIAGKKLDFKVTMKSVKAGTMPELTMDFVKQLGGFNSVEDLRESIKKGLKAEKEQKEKDRHRLELLEKISKNSEIKIPGKLVEEQLDAMVANFDQSLHERGMELGLYLAHLKKSQDDLRKEWYGQAEGQIRRGLILRELGKIGKISVDESEVQETANSLMAQYALSGQAKLSADIDPEQLKQKAAENLLNEKVFEFLESNN